MKQRKETPKSSDLPIYLFKQGNNQEAYRYFGAHLCEENGEAGAVFRVWAPHAKAVSIVGDFNSWTPGEHPMEKVTDGIWERFVPGIKQFDVYKYCITTPADELVYKADPYAFHTETRPSNGSKVYDIEGYTWGDAAWVSDEEKRDVINSPMSIYELQAGSWKMKDPENGVPYNYAELADELIPYIKEMGYTHVELLPITEYPFDGSWGYQVTGYFAPTSRYGTPKDFMAFVDKLHQAGIGVILDWVPAHFPKDGYGLYMFDGAPCYEDPNPRRGEHKEWGTMVFNYGMKEVESFLISSAMFWVDRYHVDGLRVDAVASMLYLDYNRKDGEWEQNVNGGKENLEAIAFLQKLNTAILGRYPHKMMIAEESTAWPLVTKPASDGGLGFNFKWNMGWMNDMLSYMKTDPLFRAGNHGKVTFSFFYAFSENFVLPISHDEVVHGKCSLLNKMPGDYSWEGFQWIVPDDSKQSVIAFLRRDAAGKMVLVVCNFNPVLRKEYQMGVPNPGSYKEILNSDDKKYGGSGVTNGTVKTKKGPMHGFDQHISLTLPPLSTLYLSVPAARKPRAAKAEDKAAEKPAKPAAKKTAKTTAKTAAPAADAGTEAAPKRRGRPPKAKTTV